MNPRANIGASLVELISVVGIIGMLASMSMTAMENFFARAKEVEGQTNARYARMLAKVYFEDGENATTLVSGANTSMSGLSRNDYSSETSCHYPGNSVTSQLNFKLKNCTKANYVYYFISSNSQFAIFALEGGTRGAKRIYSKCCGSSMWLANENGVFHSINPSNGQDCVLTASSIAISKIGSADPKFDLDGNGTVSPGEGTIIGNTFALYDLYPPGYSNNHISSCPP